MASDEATVDLDDLGQSLLWALDRAGIGLTIIAKRDGRLERVFVNDAGAKALGYSAEEATALPPLLAVAPEDQERLAELQKSGVVPQQLECTVIGRDGRRIPMEVGLATATHQGSPATIAFLRDVSKQRKAQEALAESERRFKQLAEAAPDVIVVLEGQRFLYVNPAGVRALGLSSREEFLSLHPSQFLSVTDLIDMQNRLRLVAAGQQLIPREYQGTRRDGTTVVLEISSISVEWEGKPAVLAYGRDVTDRARLQSQVAERDRLAAVGTLAAGIAHEVNNPLTYLMLHLEQLRRVLPHLLPDRADDVLSHVREALDGAERVSAIVRDLLELARPRALQLEPTKLAVVCETAARLARPTFEGRGTVQLLLDPVPTVATDASRLTQVLINLLVNAAQAERDSVGARVELRLRAEGDRAVLEVADDGPGIPPHLLKDIFTPFFTTKETQPDAEGGRGAGMGLGLSICHSIVEGLGGTIRAENRQTGGACFRIELPIQPGLPEPEPATPSSRSRLSVSFKRIALVDDEVAVANAISSALSEASTTVFTSASRALSALIDEPVPYDVVLSDVVMPGLRGEELESQLVLRRPEYKGRFVFMTGAAPSPSLKSRIAAGEAELIKKPFGPDALLAGLRRNEQRRRRDQ